MLLEMTLAGAALFWAFVVLAVVEFGIVIRNLVVEGTLTSDDVPTLSQEIIRFTSRHPWVLVVVGALLWHWFGR